MFFSSTGVLGGEGDEAELEGVRAWSNEEGADGWEEYDNEELCACISAEAIGATIGFFTSSPAGSKGFVRTGALELVLAITAFEFEKSNQSGAPSTD